MNGERRGGGCCTVCLCKLISARDVFCREELEDSMMQRRPSAGASGHAACSRPFARRRSAGALDPAPARSHARAHARALTVTSLRASSSRRSRVRGSTVRALAPRSLPRPRRLSLACGGGGVGESIVSPDAEARRELGARAGREGGEEDGHREKGARRQGERAGGRRRHQARRRRGARGGGEEGGEEEAAKIREKVAGGSGETRTPSRASSTSATSRTASTRTRCARTSASSGTSRGSV